MSHYSTGHDHAAPAPDAKYEHRMRYPKRAQSAASPRLDSRSLPPGELPPGSLPPGSLPPGSLPPGVVLPPEVVLPPGFVPPPRAVPPRPVPDRSTRPTRPPPADKPINDDHPTVHGYGEEYRKAMNPPQVPSTVINEPYVNHDDKMQYPKPALPSAVPRPHNIWGTCKKPGGCNKHVEDKPPPVPTTMNPVNPVVKPSARPSVGNHVEKAVYEPFWGTKTIILACVPCLPIIGAALCAACTASKNQLRNKDGDEEEPEDEGEDETEYEE
ncbi:uncharacterized protein FIESC28_08494 [Fusarium coffeatum]|uniref:Uncharacterized protein n=1 Tax=Fusarium coffeatum TaxID=231269 RepID=A0A366R7E8_9HYPO|nr:uncharacterized protein FIESC28_08494 [Fusarium coffeatum]RBR12792.1 hypothetical protein FIESC28_08494 [Fusarium coffeatum]